MTNTIIIFYRSTENIPFDIPQLWYIRRKCIQSAGRMAKRMARRIDGRRMTGRVLKEWLEEWLEE